MSFAALLFGRGTDGRASSLRHSTSVMLLRHVRHSSTNIPEYILQLFDCHWASIPQHLASFPPNHPSYRYHHHHFKGQSNGAAMRHSYAQTCMQGA